MGTEQDEAEERPTRIVQVEPGGVSGQVFLADLGTEQDEAEERPTRIGQVVPYGPSGPMFLAYLGATMAAGPFLQAVATHFGTKLAGAIDEATRAAVRRFLRRE
ncbi:hypothetical protein ACFV8Z_55915, partial [Streptomyces sp. NPDC059837]|uniref:hypothetical protein n=1 Tax=Streptomyces sp. NPDC059837 TaxID=3346968 RepID=UPI00364FA6E6